MLWEAGNLNFQVQLQVRRGESPAGAWGLGMLRDVKPRREHRTRLTPSRRAKAGRCLNVHWNLKDHSLISDRAVRVTRAVAPCPPWKAHNELA